MNPFDHLHCVAKSDLGLVRENNEDAFGAFHTSGVFCVADGMGGGDDGEFASAETVSSVADVCGKLQPSEDAGYPASVMLTHISAALNRASATIIEHVAEKSLKVCGSTFVGVVFDATAPDSAVVIHAGDSRLYRYRRGRLQRLTRDHSVAEMIGLTDDDSRVAKKLSGAIIRAVGTQEKVELEQSPFDVLAGDRIFLCSDGLSRIVSDEKLAKILAKGANGETAVAEMIDAAKQSGGIDNITVVLIDVGHMPSPLKVMSAPTDDALAEEAGELAGTLYGGESLQFKGRGAGCFRRGLFIALLAVVAVSSIVGAYLSGRINGAANVHGTTLSAAERLAVSCEPERIRRFVRVVRLLDRHGIPEGFEEKARTLASSVTPKMAEELSRDVLFSVKTGVDYARDCAERREIPSDRRTERLRLMFATLSSEIEGNPADPDTQMRCAALIQKIAEWD